MGSVAVGIVGVIIASLFWGSNFIVCKGYNLPPDGMHFVLLMSTGILLVGLLTLLSSEFEDGDFEVVFAPDGLLGGAIWAIGNFMTVPIIQNVGLGVGLSTWAGVNIIVAFVVGAVGIGSVLPKEKLTQPGLGGLGVALAVGALILFAQVRPTLSSSEQLITEEDGGVNGGGEHVYVEVVDERHLIDNNVNDDEEENDGSYQKSSRSKSDGSVPLSIEQHRHHQSQLLRQERDTSHSGNTGSSSTAKHGGNIPLGIALAVIAGICYGFQFVPLSIWNDKVNTNGHIFDHTKPTETIQALRFFFSQFAGIFLTSCLGFTVYCLFTGNRPLLVPPEAMLPSIFSGIVWSIGCCGGMLATTGLGNAVGFPLLLNVSFLVNAAWSILYFKEIRGKRNLRFFGGAFVLNVVSSVLISLSKAG